MKMKNLMFTIAVLALMGCSTSEKKDEKTEDHTQHQHDAKKEEGAKKPLSPRTSAMAMIGSNHVHIDYGSPSKRGRMIFGGLVGYGTVWATGAHKATTISFDKDVKINETSISAGKYGLFTIPGESEWTVIISKDWDMHLADDYDQANDVVRVTVPAHKLDEVAESLTFEVVEMSDGKGQISIKWDQTAVSFGFENK